MTPAMESKVQAVPSAVLCSTAKTSLVRCYTLEPCIKFGAPDKEAIKEASFPRAVPVVPRRQSAELRTVSV